MKYFGFRDWKTHQHYRDRRPPWVKLYNDIIEPGHPWYGLADEVVGQLAKLLALAAKMDNCIPFNSEIVSEEIHASAPVDLEAYAKLGLFEIVEGREPLAILEQKRRLAASKDASKSASNSDSKNACLRVRDQSQSTEADIQKDPIGSLSGSVEPNTNLPIESGEKPALTNSGSIPFLEIIDHLNAKAGTKFRQQAIATRQLIKARWNEGHRLEAFHAVIDGRVSAWGTDPKMMQYLRPKTLFNATNFESYLNGIQPDPSGSLQPDQTRANMAALEAVLNDGSSEHPAQPFHNQSSDYFPVEAEVTND